MTDHTPPGASRARVLDVLRGAPAPLGVREVAARVGLHPNTARLHLDGLVGDGLAERRTEGPAGARSGPGRPRAVYLATPLSTAEEGRRGYRLLAEILTGLVAEALPDAARASVRAGEAWGRYLVATPPPGRRVDAAEALRRLTDVLAEAGFAPGPVEPGPDPVVPLRHCPFLEIAADHPEVVCSLHLGLVRGALGEVRAPLTATRLDPLVAPSLCLAHLAPA